MNTIRRTVSSTMKALAAALLFTAGATGALAVSYTITKSGTYYTATTGSTQVYYGTSVQNAINAIRSNANGAAADITFGASGTTIDIGASTMTFDNASTPNWGAVTLRGAVTSAQTSTSAGTLIVGNAVKIDSHANIACTGNGNAVWFNSTGTFDLNSGTISAISGYAIRNENTGTVNIHDKLTACTVTGGGTGAIRNTSTGKVYVYGGLVESTSTGSSAYAIYNYAGGSVYLYGGFIRKAGTSGYAYYGNSSSSGWCYFGGNPKITGTIYVYAGRISATTSGDYAFNPGPAYNNLYTLTLRDSTLSDGLSVMSGGAPFRQNFRLTNAAGYSLAYNAASLILSSDSYMFTITKSGSNYVVSRKSGSVTSPTQTTIAGALDRVRATATGNNCSITFVGDGGALDIGANTMTFATASPAWGTVRLHGSVTGNPTGTTTGVIHINNGVSILSDADITHTGSTGNAIYHNSTGTLRIFNGTVKSTVNSTSVRAIYINSTGGVYVSGGRIEAPYSAIRNSSTASVGLSGGIIKTTSSNAYTVYNASTGSVSVSGTALVTSSSTSYATVYNAAGGEIHLNAGTIENLAGGNAVQNANSSGRIYLPKNIPLLVGGVTTPDTKVFGKIRTPAGGFAVTPDGTVSAYVGFDACGNYYEVELTNPANNAIVFAGGNANNLHAFNTKHSYNLAVSGGNLVVSTFVVPFSGYKYMVYKNGGSFVAAWGQKNGPIEMYTGTIQGAINAIKTGAAGQACEITFMATTDVTAPPDTSLDIGTSTIIFDGGSTGRDWGQVTLKGYLYGNSANYVIYAANGVSLVSEFEVRNTNVSSGNAIQMNNNSTLTVNSGEISGNGGYAIYNYGGMTRIAGGNINDVNQREGCLHVSGGTFTGGNNRSCVNLYHSGKVKITGGTFTRTHATQGPIWTSGGTVDIEGGTFSNPGAGSIAYMSGMAGRDNQTRATLNISGGNFTSSGTVVRNVLPNDVNITGGTLTSTSYALYNSGPGSVNVAGTANISSESGTASIYNTGTDGVINIMGGTVNNTSSSGAAVRNTQSTGTINLGNWPTMSKNIYTPAGRLFVRTADHNIFNPGSKKYPVFVSGTITSGSTVAVANGGSPSRLANFTSANGGHYLTVNGANLVLTAKDFNYRVYGSGTSFTATDNNNTRTIITGATIQNTINAIKADVYANPCDITFYAAATGTTQLDIGTATMEFNRSTADSNWSSAANGIKLHGSVKSASTSTTGGVVIGSNGAVVTSDATIQNTSTGAGNAIYWNSTGTLTVNNGGKVSAVGSTAYAIRKAASGTVDVSGTGTTVSSAYYGIYGSSGAINVSGGTVSSTGIRTIYITGTGTVTVSGSGTVSNSYNGGYAINNSSTGATTVSGGTVIATGSGNSYAISQGDVNVTGGTVSSTYQAINASSKTINISGGTVTGTGPQTIMSRGTLNVSGGTVSNTGTGLAIYNADVYNVNIGTVTISGTALVTSAPTSSGTICNITSSGSANNIVNVVGGTVRNTANSTSARAIHNYCPGGVINVYGGTIQATSGAAIENERSTAGSIMLGNSPTITGSSSEGAIRVPSNSLGVETSGANTFNPASKTYPIHINSTPLAGAIAVFNGAAPVNRIDNFPLVNANYRLITSGNNLVVQAQTLITAVNLNNTAPAYGDTITATVTPSGATSTATWQWQYHNGSTWSNISGATASSYTVPATMIGAQLRVTATGTGEYYGTVTSAATSAVTPKTLTWNAGSASNKVYDGNATATVVSAPTLNGVINSDTVTITVGTAAFADKNVGNNKAVTGFGWGIGGAHANYYLITTQPSFGFANITPRPLSWNGSGSVDNKEYDGTTAATIANLPMSNIVVSDTVTAVPGTAVVSFQTATVGNNKAIVYTAGTWVLTGADADNYTAPTGNPGWNTPNITPRQLTWTGNGTVSDKVYDGNADAQVTSYPGFGAVVAGENVSLNFSGVTAVQFMDGTGTIPDGAPGLNKPVASTGVWALSGTDAANYIVPAGQPGWNPASITIDADYQYVVTYGNDPASGNPSTSFFTATCNNGVTVVAQDEGSMWTIMQAIRNDANGNNCSVTFDSGTAGVPLDIGSQYAEFNGNWGSVELHGSVTSTAPINQGTIYVSTPMSITSDADIEHTGFNSGNAVKIVSDGTFHVIGGTVSATGQWSSAIRNESDSTVIVSDGVVTCACDASDAAIENVYSGAVEVTGGTVECTGKGNAIRNSNDGSVTISGTALVTAAYYNGTVYNNGNGVVTVRGGTVQNTYDASSVPMGAPLCVIYNHAGGTINAYGGVIDLRMTAIRNNAAGTVSLGNDPILNGIYTAEGKVSAVTAGPDEFTPGENVYGIYITSSPIVSGSTVAVVDGADFLGNFVSWNYDGVLNVGYVCTASGDDLVLSAAATVYFYHNAPDATGDMEPQTELYGEIENLAPNGFSRDGYVFMGWALTDDGPVAYADEAPFTFIENITLFAVWLAPISEGDDGSGEDDGWYLQVVDGTPGAVLGTDWWILRKGDGSRRPAPNTNPNYVGDNLVDVVPGNTIDHDPYDGDYDPWIVPEVPGFPPSDYDYIFDPNVPEIRIYDRDSGDEVAVVDLPTGEVDYKIAVAVLKNFMYSNVREQTLGQYFPLDTDLDPLEGTVAIITVFDALGEIVAGPYAGRLDADGNIILDDVVPHSAVGVGYTLEVVIRSEVFEVEPFAIRRGPSVVLDDDLDTDDTEIGTVWPGDMPGVTNDAPVVIIVITDEGDGTTTTNSVPGHLEGPDPDGPYVIVIDDGSELPPGEIVDIIFGDEPPYIVPIDPGDGTVTGIENDYTYVITGGSGSFVATRNGGIHKVTPAAGLGIQAAIVAIQADADGHDCSITFDPGLATALDIGNAHIDFDDFTRAWGLITLHGSVENSSWTTISIYGGVSVISDADILATGSLCSAIALDSTGDLAITGGTMTGDVAVFKVDDSTGDIYILGGTLISTAGYEAVCYDSRYGELVLGNAPTIEGFISAPAGTIRVITGSNPNTFNPGEEIYAVAIWDFYDNLIISGTTVAVVDGADFLANFTAVNPGYVLDILGDDLILRNPTPVQPPLVDNTTPEYGDTLTATEQPAGATVTWQWEWYDDVNNEWLPITDATNATYTVVADDIGLELRVVVNGEGLYAGAAASAATDPVAPRTLTLVNGAVHPREYDGTTVAVVGDQPELAGVITGDDVTFIPGTASFADKDVGLGKTATGAGYALDGADAGLYTLAAQPVFIADIIPLQLTWVGNGKVANKQYDGNAFASILSLPTISSALPGETVMLNSTGAWACFIDEHCGIAKHVYSEGVWLLSGPYAGNYSLPGQPSWNPADIYAPEGTDGNGWYLDVPDGSDYANGAPGTDWWRLREGTGSRRPALNDNPNYVGTNLVNVVPGNTIEHYPGDNEFVPPWVVPEVENCPPSDYDYIFDPNVPEIRVYDRETGNLVVVIDIPSGDETHPNANANLTDTLYTGVGGQTIGKYFPADDDTAPLEGRVVEVWILDDNGITADGPLAGHLDAAGNIILDDVLEGSLADWGTDFALVVHVGDDTFIKKPVTIVQGATADLKITAIRMITATGNIEITVEGCVNTAKQYALFGHHEEISARYDNGAVSQNAEVIAAGRQYGVNDGVGQRVFTFPKPGHDRFFFHARQID